MSHPSYLSNMFVRKNWDLTIKKTLKELRPLSATFDSIAFRGLSGGLIAPIICYNLKKGMVAVRKSRKDEPCHSSNSVESETDCIGRYIILDDQISSGATVLAMLDAIKNAKLEGRCVGIYTYQGFVTRGSIFRPGDKDIPRIASCL